MALFVLSFNTFIGRSIPIFAVSLENNARHLNHEGPKYIVVITTSAEKVIRQSVFLFPR